MDTEANEDVGTKLEAAITLSHASGRLTTYGVNYNDYKAAQLCEALSDLLLAEIRVEAWTEDLGTKGCQGSNTTSGDCNAI